MRPVIASETSQGRHLRIRGLPRAGFFGTGDRKAVESEPEGDPHHLGHPARQGTGARKLSDDPVAGGDAGRDVFHQVGDHAHHREAREGRAERAVLRLRERIEIVANS